MIPQQLRCFSRIFRPWGWRIQFWVWTFSWPQLTPFPGSQVPICSSLAPVFAVFHTSECSAPQEPPPQGLLPARKETWCQMQGRGEGSGLPHSLCLLPPLVGHPWGLLLALHQPCLQELRRGVLPRAPSSRSILSFMLVLGPRTSRRESQTAGSLALGPLVGGCLGAVCRPSTPPWRVL